MAKGIGKSGLWTGLGTDKHTHADTHTHKHTQPKETKTRRVQLLTYDSLVDRMDAYGAAHQMSRAEVFEMAVAHFLDENGG
jgi:hypothetical protein